MSGGENMKTIGKEFKRSPNAGFVLRLLSLGVAAHISLAMAQAPGILTATGNMTTPRHSHTATLIPNGKVLIAGGGYGYNCNCARASAELYDPSTGTFTATGDMTTPRQSHTATLLPSGKVLIAGGSVLLGRTLPLANAELYDPSTETFTATGEMTTTRASHTASLLNNGKVLIAAGVSTNGVLASAELYDPPTGTFTRTGDMTTGRWGHTATLLKNDKVLMFGTDTETVLSPELYDPDTGTFSLTGGTTFERLGVPTTATLLTNGKVLVTLADVGGEGRNWAALYDPSTGTFTATGNMIIWRLDPAATLLVDGTVLIAGSDYFWGEHHAEIYDPVTGTFLRSGQHIESRWNAHSPTATLLPDGTVLITGGFSWDLGGSRSYTLDNAELYHPPLHVIFNPNTVRLGGSFTASFSGANLTADTYFDIQFRRPGSSIDEVALDWQKGTSAPHTVATSLAVGTWTVTGVRPHQNLTDHSSDFFPVSVTLTVSPF
jgi:Galactose oxidase, central domain